MSERAWMPGQAAARVAAAALTASLLLMGAGCGGGGGGGGETTPTPAVVVPDTATVGAAGGSLAHADGVKLSVPPGALATPLTLRVARDTTGMNAALLGVAPDPGKSVDLSPTYAMTPHGTAFAEPVELRIPLDAAALNGPGMLAVLRTEPGRGDWQLIPVAKVEGGAAVVQINGFSFYKAVRVVALPVQIPGIPPAPPLLEMSATLGGAGPESYTIPSTAFPNNVHRRLYGEITSRAQTLRYEGRVTGLPATCSTVRLGGMVRASRGAARGEDAPTNFGPGQSDFATLQATSGTTVTNGVTRPTLSFSHDLNIDNAPFKAEVFNSLRAASNTGATPTMVLGFNAWAHCSTPVDLGGGNVLGAWQITPGITQLPPEPALPGAVRFDDKGWAVNAVLYKVDYLPQGYISHPADVTVAAGASASFSTSAWPTPVGEQRLEWWRSNNDGASWTRVRTSLVPVSDTADTFTLAPVASTDHNALFRARLCTVPRQANVAEACVDGLAARLSVLQGTVAASFTQQPRALLVRTGQTASLGVQVAGLPAPTLRWQSRPANSAGAWSDVATGTGAATPNYTTPPLTLADNGLQLRAVASNSAGEVASLAVSVSVSEVDVAPTLQTQPAALNVVAGSEAVFAVVARGTEALSYQWRRNGQPIAGATAPVLKLAAVTAGDASGYSVQVSNGAGSVTSDTAALVVNAATAEAVAPTIVTQPVSVLTHVGNTATFGVGVAGSGPFSYQWLKAGQPLAGANAATFSVAAATLGDDGSYAVRVSNAVGSVTSWNVVLTVNEALTPQAVAIGTQPSPQMVLPGGSATFAVAASGSGPLRYQWLKDGMPINGATASVLVVAEAGAGDQGSYSVTVGNDLGSVSSDAAGLTVIGAPTLTGAPAPASVTEGATATFTVAATGSGLRYQWTRNGDAIPGASAASYTTPALTLADSGAVYGVVVFNGAGLVFGPSALLTVTPAPVATPAQALGKIAMGSQHSCAITATQAVACWGGNGSGQIGRGDRISQPTPFVWTLPEAAVQVAAGGNGSCAVTVSGQVWCSGSPTSSTVPVRLAGFGGVQQVTLGTVHACLLQGDGTVWCWGNNGSHQLGDGSTTPSATPVRVQGTSGFAINGVLGIDAGENHTCALMDDHGVRCWGVNDWAQSGSASNVVTSRATPVAGAGFVDHIAAGTNFTCVYSSESGNVRCWGLALDGSDVGSPSPQEAGPASPVAVGAGSAMACVIDASARVWCWGTGPMGNGNVNDIQPVPVQVGGLTRAVAVAGGQGHTCVLRSTGALVCWGSNGSYQLGTGDAVARTTPTEVPLAGGFWH